MLEEIEQKEKKLAEIAVSILYLRCDTAVRRRLADSAVEVSILYLRCGHGVSVGSATVRGYAFQFSI